MRELYRGNQIALELGQSSPRERLSKLNQLLTLQQEHIQKVDPGDIQGHHILRELEQIMMEELDRLPSHRPLTPAEVEQVSEAIAERASERMMEEMQGLLRDSYITGIREASVDFGTGFSFTPHHQRIFDDLTDDRALADSFATFSDEKVDTIKNVLVSSYEEGVINPGRVTQRLVREIGWEMRDRLRMIANTEAWKVYTSAKEERYMEMEEEFDEEFLYEFGTIDDHKTCDACQEIMEASKDGLPMDELKETMVNIIGQHMGDSWDPMRDRNFPLPHPNCVVSRRTPIRTEDGWTPIGDIEEGVKVLTHKGNWKPVTHVFKPRKHEGTLVTIRPDTPWKTEPQVTVTGNHPILIDSDEGPTWKYAKDLLDDDQVFMVSKPCEGCGKRIPEASDRVTCSKRCMVDRVHEQRDTPEWRKKLSKSASEQLKREYADGTRDPHEITKPARIALREKYGPGLYFETGEQIRRGEEDNPSKRPDVKAKISEANSGERNGMWGMTESKNHAWKPFVEQESRRCAPPSARDITLRRDEHKCQCCGKSQDEAREEYGFGLDVHHITPYRYTKDHDPENLMTVCRTCHMWIEDINDVEYLETGGAQFTPFPIEVEKEHRKIDPEKGKRRLPTVYNIEVEDDHSYVARGFVVQNCRHDFARVGMAEQLEIER